MRHSPALKQLPLRRDAHISRYIIFHSNMTPREAGAGDIGNPGKGRESVEGRVSVPFPRPSMPSIRVTPGFLYNRPKPIYNESLTLVGSGRKAKSIHFIALGLD